MRHLQCTILAVTLFLSGWSSLAEGGNRAGSVTGQFLKLPVNARATAMGNAQVALAEGAGSIAFNPSGILSVSQLSFGGTYHAWWADITHSFLGVAVNLQELGTVGIGATFLTTDDMVVTTPGFPEGTGELFKATEFAYTFAYARQISEMFGLGLSVKYITSNMYNTTINDNTIAFDIGTIYDIPILRTRLGISVTNLGRDLKYLNEQYSIPTALRFGARVNLYDQENHRVFGAVQIGRPNDADEQYNVGLEYAYEDLVFLRGGYRFNYDVERWSGGLGVSLGMLGIQGKLDYAYTDYKYLPGTHMITTEIGF